MSEVFMAERGQLDDRSKRELRKAGVVVVEVEDLAKATFLRSSEVISGDDMLWAAMNALKKREKEAYGASDGHTQRLRLAANLIGLVEASRGARTGGDS
jgi:hypothetical protein